MRAALAIAAIALTGCAHPPKPQPLTPAQVSREVQTIQRIRQQITGNFQSIVLSWKWERDPEQTLPVEFTVQACSDLGRPIWLLVGIVEGTEATDYHWTNSFVSAPARFYRVGSQWKKIP